MNSMYRYMKPYKLGIVTGTTSEIVVRVVASENYDMGWYDTLGSIYLFFAVKH